MRWLMKFFLVSELHPGHAVLLTASCVVLGLWTISYNPSELDSALGLLLVLQMFLASTGFVSRASAGHFDAVLVEGRPRRSAALAHWAVSVGPGVAGWIVLAVTALALGGAHAVSAICGRRFVALAIVSNVAWIAGFRLPRHSAGVLWLALLVAVLLQQNLRALSMMISPAFRAWAWDILVLLVCPFVLIGDQPAVPPPVLAGAATLSCLAVWVVVSATTRLNVLLVDRG